MPRRLPPTDETKDSASSLAAAMVSPQWAGLPLLLANFSKEACEIVRELVATFGSPAPMVMPVPRPVSVAVARRGGILVVRDFESVGAEKVLALYDSYEPALILIVARSLEAAAPLRTFSRLPFVVRQHPLSPSDLVALVRSLCAERVVTSGC